MKWLKAGRHLAKGDRARDDRDWAKAALCYERFLRRKPHNAAIWVQLGHMHKECGQLASAGTAYQTALNLAPHDADIHFQIGQLNKLAGNMQFALLAFRRALAIDPHFDSAQREIRQLGDEMPLSDNQEELKRLKKEVRELSGRLLMVERTLTELAPLQGIRGKPIPSSKSPL